MRNYTLRSLARIMRPMSLGIVFTAVFAVGAVQGQMTTEQFIPIGMSPGLSGTYTWIGEITAVDQSARTVTVRNPAGEERTIRLTDSTRIWIDRSQMQQANTVGRMSDIVVGRRTEIKYLDRQRPEVADWIKVAGS